MKLCFLLTALLLLAVAPTEQSDEPPISGSSSGSASIKVGFNGFYKLGHWIPAQLREPVQAVEAVDDEGTPTQFCWDDPNTAAKQRYIRVGRPAFPGGTAVLNSQQLVVVLGERLDLTAAIRLQQLAADETTVATNVSPEDLPLEWFGWDGVDLLVVATGEAPLIERVNPQQWAAITTWLKTGGRLLVSAGSNAPQFLVEGHPLAGLAPGTLRQVLRQRETGGLENYAAPSRRAASKRIRLTDDRGRFAGLPGLALENTDGLALCSDGRGDSRVNWIVQRAFGLGLITFVATDLDTTPITEWDGHARLLMRLLGDALHGRNDEVTEWSSQSVSHFGFNDISGQLRLALEQFDGVRIVPFALVGLMAVGFAIIIGPLDYFILGTSASRSKWTWATLACTVGLATVAVVTVAKSWKGTAFQTNQVTLVDLDAATGSVRGTNWTHVYVANTSEIDLTWEPGFQLLETEDGADQLVGWHGLAGNGFGGMNSRMQAMGPMAVQLPPYSIRWRGGDGGGWSSAVEGMLVPQWSSRRFGAIWRATSQAVSETDLKAGRSGMLVGTLYNPFNVPLKSAYLCYDRWRFDLGELRPGQRYEMDPSAVPMDLHSKLTQRRIMDSKQIASPWNEESFDIARIMEMIMFHDAAGGRSYTGLLHRQAGWLDLSDQLKLQRAVLVGRVDTRDAPVHVRSGAFEPDMECRTVCRVVFPVEAIKSGTAP